MEFGAAATLSAGIKRERIKFYVTGKSDELGGQSVTKHEGIGQTTN